MLSRKMAPQQHGIVQGLGKTVQMLALIVSNVPSRENALKP